MTTSGVTSGLSTVRDIVRDALQEIGVVAVSQEVDAADEALAMRRLNAMLKEWQLDGVNLWRTEDVTITWPAGTAEGDLASTISEIQRMSVVASYDRQLERWDRDQIASLPNGNTVGVPTVFATIERVDGLTLRLWPVPSAETTLKATISRTVEDVTNGNETLDIPQKYTSTVVMNLAARLVNAFGRADENTVIVVREAARLYNVLRSSDRPASYFFEKG